MRKFLTTQYNLSALLLIFAYIALLLSVLPWMPYLGGVLGFMLLGWIYYDEKKYKKIYKEKINHATKICLLSCLFGLFLYSLCSLTSCYKLYQFNKETEKKINQVLSNSPKNVKNGKSAKTNK